MIPVFSTLRVITPPASEPLTLAQIKTFCRIYETWEDDLVGSLLTTARAMVEEYLGRVLVTQTLLATFKLQPHYIPYTGMAGYGPWGWGFGSGMGHGLFDGSLEIPRAPVQSLTSVTLRGHDGTNTVISNAAYNLDIELDPARFRILWHEVQENFPTVILPIQHVQIEFIAGYGGSEYNEAIPNPILQAIYLLTNYLYERRGDEVQMPEIPKAIYYLLDPYRLQSFGGQNG